MSKDHAFKHEAFILLSDIKVRVMRVEGKAKDNIHDVLGIETRDLCQDLIHKIDMFEHANQVKLMPKAEGE